jgi:NAD(P)-dependent dehydrogenase (short-subunit alcohol dehydrogenase family)
LSKRLQGQRIIVLGGSSGIGQSTAKTLATEGADVIIASRSTEKLWRAAEAIGHPVLSQVLDISDGQQVETFFRKAEPFDHLVITAATAVAGNFIDLDVAEARRFFDSKFWGPYMAARAAVPKIRTGGSITFFAGAASHRGSPGFSCGSTINAAIETLSKTLAVELAPIRVNTISPGYVRTPALDELMDPETLTAMLKEVEKAIPVHRIGTPDEIAHAVLFLIENTYTTGTVLFVDGGLLQT